MTQWKPKQLVWRSGGTGWGMRNPLQHFSSAPIIYWVVEQENGLFKALIDGIYTHDLSEQEAKAACQADFESKLPQQNEALRQFHQSQVYKIVELEMALANVLAAIDDQKTLGWYSDKNQKVIKEAAAALEASNAKV